MSKFMRMAGVAVWVVLAACATTPVREPEPGEEPRPEQPAEPVRDAPLRIGVIVSGSGSPVLQQYGALVLEGVRLGAEAERTDRRDVEVVVRDDGGTAAGAAQALRELEQAGIRVIVGPLMADALVAAARARSGDGVVLISPTAVSEPVGTRNVYALNVVDTRGAAALGEHARRHARVGVLHARTHDAVPARHGRSSTRSRRAAVSCRRRRSTPVRPT
jgi:ABC-type branched-subunit amino acid transport system substrate-binding protein